jgi:hypothetical protein
MTEPRTPRLSQDHCPACGRFARYPQDFTHDVVCVRCESDPRAGVQANREMQIGVAERRSARQRARLLERGS